MKNTVYTNAELRRMIDFQLRVEATPNDVLRVIQDFNGLYGIRLPGKAMGVYLNPLLEDLPECFELTCQFYGDKVWHECVGWIDLIQIAEKVTGVRMRDAELHQFVNDYFQDLSSHIRTVYKVADEADTPDTQRKSKPGPTVRTQERYAVFSRLKGEHPEWSQDRVAMESLNELDEFVTAETVRNTYRQMDKKWERADRIR